MKRYAFRLSYIGTCYRGSQKHVSDNVVDVDSIQGAVESSIMKVFPRLSHSPQLVLAGRTDAGVHAMCTTAHMDLDYEFGNTVFDTTHLVKLMNRYFCSCRHDIRILSCQEVSNDFHARYSAKSRKYLYRFLLAKNPNDHKIPIAEMYRTLHLHSGKDKFDIEKLKEGLELFQGTKDFRTFSARTHSKNPDDDFKRNYVRTLQVTLEKGESLMPFDPNSNNFDYWNIIFTSRAFLYNQIRRIVGALVGLGDNKLSKEDIITMLQVPSHHNWNSRASPAPAHGLYLMNVDYGEEINFD